MKEKIELRSRILAARDLLSSEERAKKSLQIKSQLTPLSEYQKAKTIMFYFSFGSEVETITLIKEAMSQGKVVALPLTVPKNKEMLAMKVENLNKDLTKSPFGFKEPIKERTVEIRPVDIDLVIIPGVAFDLNGCRLGRGAGYYDRFLKRVNAKTPRIALAFEMQIMQKIPVDIHDIKVNKVITENRTITCPSVEQ